MVFERIRNLREDNDKKQQELADYLNVKQTTYSKYELGKVNIPIEVFMKLADYYDVSVDYLLGRTAKKKQANSHFLMIGKIIYNYPFDYFSCGYMIVIP